VGITASLILIAAGAILRWGVTAQTSGIDLDIVGLILIIIGIVGFLLSIIWWSSWGGLGAWRTAPVRRREVVTRDTTRRPTDTY
jgi:hypothetical protein